MSEETFTSNSTPPTRGDLYTEIRWIRKLVEDADRTFRESIQKLTETVESHGRILRGYNGTPGLLQRTARLEEITGDAKRTLAWILAVLSTGVVAFIGSVIWWVLKSYFAAAG